MPTRPWTQRPSPRATGSGSRRHGRGHLLGKILQVDRLLDWAEKQLEPIGAGSQQSAAHLVP
eukprot:4353292-Alexandrium_andersonii.AAC.1